MLCSVMLMCIVCATGGGSSEQQLTTYGFEADMWSIGVVAYVLLSGDYPWSGDSGLMCQEIAAGRPNYQKNKHIWQSLSPAAVDFISQLIVLDPAARLTAQQALQHPWFDSVRLPAPSFPLHVEDSASINRPNGGGSKHSSTGGDNSSCMPPPVTTTTRQTKGKKKRTFDHVDPAPDDHSAAVQQRCSRSRVGTGSAASDGHAPMEISLSTNTRTRLPRKAKQISIGQFCQKKK